METAIVYEVGEETTVATDLTTADRAELGRYERVIERGLMSFMEVGTALIAIRDGKLYRGTHGTFEEYCQGRWGISRSYAHRTIGAVEVVNNLLPIGNILPATESQARPLTALEPEQQREAWAKAVEDAPSGKPTAADVQKAAAKFSEPKPTKPRAEVKRVAEPYEAPKPTPAKVVYVEPKLEPTIEVGMPADLVEAGYRLESPFAGAWRYTRLFQGRKIMGIGVGTAIEAINLARQDFWASVPARSAHPIEDAPATMTFMEPRVIVEPDEPATEPTPDELEAVALVAAEVAEEDAERAARAATRPSFENVPEPVVEPEPKSASMLTREWVVYVLVNYTPASSDFGVALKAATPDDLSEAMAGFDQEERHWRARLAAIKGRMTEMETLDPRIAQAREGMELIAAGRAWVRDNYLKLTGKEINTLAFWRDTSEMLGDLESLVDILTGKDVTK